jgi:DNA-binding FadR family transcriptional regulator
MLSALGRLSVRKGVGIIVTEPTSPLLYEWVANFLPGNLDQVNMLFELRRTLETEAARLAALRASPSQVLDIATAVEHCEAAAKADDFSAFRQSDEEFHRSVVVASHNSFLVTLVVVVTQLKSQVLTIGLHGQSSGSLILAANQHRLISEAIVSAQPEQAVSAMLEHIDVNFKQYQQAIQRWIAMSDGSTI